MIKATITRCLVVIFLLCMSACSQQQESKQAELPQQSVRTIMPGDITTLSGPDGGIVPVASSKKALDRLTQLSVAKDTIGIGQMMADGLVSTVPTGTKCRVIDRTDIFTCEVRIIDGGPRPADKTCFVSRDFVK